MVDRVLKNGAIKARASTASPPARPFQCQWHQGCPKSFNRKSDLQRHYRIHTNERPYACDYKPCEKTFIQRSALTVHRRTHTGDKPHRCPYLGCGKCFSDSSSLARHRRIHTNDKPYICENPDCRKAFCRKTTMTKHFRKEHPADSIEREEDGDYSENEQSDSDPSLDQDGDESPDSTGQYGDSHIKSEATTNGAASNYDANLWRLPAQTAQGPKQHQVPRGTDLRSDLSAQNVKMERSMSGTPQRSLTDSTLNRQMPANRYIDTARANSLSDKVARSLSVDMAMWQAHRSPESPTTMTSPHNFPMHGMNMPTSAYHQYQHQALPIRKSSLQPIHDIVHDEPPQALYSQVPQHDYTPTHGSQYSQAPPDFRDSMPSTPVSGQQLPQYASSMDAMGAPYQTPQALPMEDYNIPMQAVYGLPQASSVQVYHETMDLYKDLKAEDAWSQMPDSAVSWGM